MIRNFSLSDTSLLDIRGHGWRIVSSAGGPGRFRAVKVRHYQIGRRPNDRIQMRVYIRQAVTLPYTWPNGHRLQDCEGSSVVWRRLQWATATERHMHLHNSKQPAQFATSNEHQIYAGIHLLEIINEARLNFKFTLITKRQNCSGDQSTRFITPTKCTVLINPLKTKHRLLYLKTQSVPRCKHFSSRL